MRTMAGWMTTLVVAGALLPPPCMADPCGMVPPLWIQAGSGLTRVGVQRTYVFHADGIETLVLRPGFEGKVDEFGMLIPFPSPPTIRKVAENVFEHVAAAIDPPEVVVDLRSRLTAELGYMDSAVRASAKEDGLELRRDQVEVLSEEAVGMYEVAVLSAGGAEALAGWMNANGFRYPEGMDAVVEDYVSERWCFVAVKARVGQKSGADPRPGQRDVDVAMPADASFDGHVQAMGFRFRTDELVVPMRLSAFNPGELHNVVYVLAEQGVKIADLPDEFVVRQVPGRELLKNLVNPLPLRVLGEGLIPDWQLRTLPQQRDPRPHNGIARELFASDLLSISTGQLAHTFEQREKEMLAIGEDLGLRGPDYEALVAEAVRSERERQLTGALERLAGMTMTVIDGDFPRAILARQNLTFPSYEIAAATNQRELYDARFDGPPPILGGTLETSSFSGPDSRALASALFGVALLALMGMFLVARRQRSSLATVGVALLAGVTLGQEDAPLEVCRLPAPIDPLAPVVAQGHEIVRWASSSEPESPEQLVAWGASASPLVQTWAHAARIQRVTNFEQLEARALDTVGHGALVRPLSLRWRALTAAGQMAGLEQTLRVAARQPALGAEFLPALVDGDVDSIIEVMLTAEGDDVRRLAAGVCATAANARRETVAWSILTALSCQSRAQAVPWKGGALFVPGLAWTSNEAQLLASDLIGWLVLAETRGWSEERSKIQANLGSWGLANAAGFQLGASDGRGWLQCWRNTYGRDALLSLMIRFNVTTDPRYADLAR